MRQEMQDHRGQGQVTPMSATGCASRPPRSPAAAGASFPKAEKRGVLAARRLRQRSGPVIDTQTISSHKLGIAEAGMTVKDAMTRNPITIDPDAPLATAMATMTERQVRHLPVVDDQERLVGMITDRDLRNAAFSPALAEYLSRGAQRRLRGLAETFQDMRVRDAMTWGVVTTSPQAPLAQAAAIMAEGPRHCPPCGVSIPTHTSGSVRALVEATRRSEQSAVGPALAVMCLATRSDVRYLSGTL
jgi:CBS domain-containing protein